MKLFKRLKLCWRRFNYDESWAADTHRLMNKVEWKARLEGYERREYVRKMSGGYPTGEKP
jgi:hypothetical protein